MPGLHSTAGRYKAFVRKLIGLMLVPLLLGTMVRAQTPRYTDDPRNQSPTVTGGTGLFTVYDAQTLRKGEFNFGFFANRFHRDPGNVRFQRYPVSFQIGFGDRFEFFANFEYQTSISVGTLQLLSGFYLPDVRTPGLLKVGRLVIVPGQNGISVLSGDPCGNGGFPGPCLVPGSLNVRGAFTARPSGNATAVYVGLGAPVGGILPALLPNVNPNYLPQAPFIARLNDRHTGDLWLGGKIRLTGPNNSLGLAVIPLLKIPTTRTLDKGLERGRGTGNFEYGAIVALDRRLQKHINLSTNIGYIKKLDPRAEDMNLGQLCVGCGVIQGFGRSDRALDIPDELRGGLGVDFPVTKHLQVIAEVSATHYVGSRTPTVLKNSPVDLIVGAKIYPHRSLSITAAYQRHANWFSDTCTEGFGTTLDVLHSPNGFIVGLSIGRTNKRIDPVLPNQPPTVRLGVGAVTPGGGNFARASAQTICEGDKVALRALASDPDGDTLLYSWQGTGGRIVGDGTTTSFDTAGLAPGEYTVTVQVDDGCGGVAFDSKSIRVTNCLPPTTGVDSNPSVGPDRTAVRSGDVINPTTPRLLPDFRNETFDRAADQGDARAFRVSFVRVVDYNNSVAPGIVTRQEPDPGTLMSPGMAVRLWVAESSPTQRTRPLPDFRNATFDQAADQADTKLFRVTFVSVVDSNNSVVPGIVTRQQPDPGTPMSPGMVVRLWVAESPRIQGTRPLPDFRNDTFDQAADHADTKGFRVALVRVVDYNNSVAPGIVTRQQPDPGTLMSPGMAVRLWVAENPPNQRTRPLPDFRNDTFDQAADHTDTRRFRVTLVREVDSNNSVAPGIVTRQEPDPGTPMSRGMAVRLWVAEASRTAEPPNVRTPGITEPATPLPQTSVLPPPSRYFNFSSWLALPVLGSAGFFVLLFLLRRRGRKKSGADALQYRFLSESGASETELSLKAPSLLNFEIQFFSMPDDGVQELEKQDALVTDERIAHE